MFRTYKQQQGEGMWAFRDGFHAANQWVPISEGYPQDTCRVWLTVIGWNEAILGNFFPIYGTWVTEDGELIQGEVTHWMPHVTPQPYKESE